MLTALIELSIELNFHKINNQSLKQYKKNNNNKKKVLKKKKFTGCYLLIFFKK